MDCFPETTGWQSQTLWALRGLDVGVDRGADAVVVVAAASERALVVEAESVPAVLLLHGGWQCAERCWWWRWSVSVSMVSRMEPQRDAGYQRENSV